MDAKRYLLVKPLACEEAWTLFSELVGEDTLNSSPGIQQLAHSTLERCQGLPSAIIMAGQTLAGCKIVREWEQLTRAGGPHKRRNFRYGGSIVSCFEAKL